MTALARVLHALALSLWLSAVVASGLTAALAFPTLARLAPTLPDYAAYPGPHAPLAAGHLAERGFRLADRIALPCAALAGLTLLLGSRRPAAPPRAVRLLRTLAIALPIAVLATRLIWMQPVMDRHLSAYRAAAAAGDTASADVHRAAFTRLHPAASAMLTATAASLALAIALAPIAPARRA